MELGNLMFGNSRGEYPIEDRREWEDVLVEFLDKTNTDYYGYFNNKEEGKLKIFETNRGGFENDVYKINPYYWGDDEDIAEESNFIYKPTGFTIDWYKYPFRDSYMNQDISLEDFKGILQDCYKSYLKSIQYICK